MQKFFSGSDATWPKAMVPSMTVAPIPRATRKHRRSIIREEVEMGDTIVALELRSEHYQKKHVMVPRTTVTKKPTTSKPGEKEKNEEQHHLEREETFNDKKAAILPRRFKVQVPFDKNISLERKRNGKITVDYRNNK